MTVLFTTALLTVLVFGLSMAVRRGVVSVQPIQAILGLRRRGGSASAARKPRRASRKKSASATQTSMFHAVSIAMDPSPCQAVKAYADQTMLSSEAPVLPLQDCDQAACKCRYVHQDDRRSQYRRGYQSSLALMASVGSNQERRRSVGRRETDVEELE